MFRVDVRKPSRGLLNPTIAEVNSSRLRHGFVSQILVILLQGGRKNTPIGESGELMRSMSGDAVQTGRFSSNATLSWTTSYAAAVDEGSRPHWAPIRRLALWGEFRGFDDAGIGFLQRWIAINGTRGKGYLAKTRTAVLDRLTTATRQFARSLVDSL